ncbi:hypothetical protein [Marivirga sp.]|uniref:hypothetical protein n=1 Tax=Marivirga sp. TaxID=2018662 RepID=UPI002D7F7BB3|nr:hypothetical protein [Marivirga sp.]HET8858839.1 hypothetical protein [Marivirga sp.]
MRTLFYALTVILLIVISSCENEIDELELIQEEIQSQGNEAVKTNIAKSIAKRVASNIDQVEFRNYIKNKALTKFDEDVNFLLLPNLDDKIFLNQRGKSESLSSILQLEETSKRKNGMGLLDSIKTYYPLLQIAVSELDEGYTENWSIDNHEPIVAYVPEHIDNDIIPAFNQQGDLIELSAEQAPDELVVIVSENERVLEISKDDETINFRNSSRRCPIEPVYQTDENNYYLKSDYYDALICELPPIDDGGNDGGGSTSNYCNRDRSSSKDILFKFKLNSQSVYKDAKDGWFNNDMEIRVDILFGKSNGAVSNIVKYLNVRQRDIKNEQWVSFNAEVVNWDKYVWGNSMKYSWLEDDGDGSTKITYNWSSEFEDEDDGTTENVSFSAEVLIPKDHYRFGDSVVEYCDNKNGNFYNYNTGRLTFEVR